MTLDEFEVWYKKRFRTTTSAYNIAAMILSDLIGVMLSFGTGFFLVNLYDRGAISFRSFVTYWPYLPVFIIVFQLLSLYPGIALAPAEEVRHFAAGCAISFGGIIFSRYIEDKEFDAITAAFFISFIFSTVILLVCRSIIRGILSATKLGGIPAVVYGSGGLARMLIDKLLKDKTLSYVPVVILDDKAGEAGGHEEYRGIPVIHDTSLGPALVKRLNLKMAIVAAPELSEHALSALLTHSVSAFRYNVLLPSFLNVTNIWMNIRDFNGMLGFASTNHLQLWWNRMYKRALDLFAVITGGLVILPVLLAIALLVKITSPGPILYGHSRIGQNGKVFKAYKFRTMAKNAEELLARLLDSDPLIRKEWDEAHKIKNDPRITRFGRFLRRTSLDEFPQLINVLKGEMSLVGPRPIVDDEIKRYGGNFQRIFSVKPGITGLWQVSGRSDTDYFDRVSFDTYYLQSWSIWLDLWVLYRTIGVVLGRKGAY
ncbi:MAG: undecaprenyl-phosphate galactose phosphotransferase WbaP [Spirochaetaceae bacterium]|jgi:Undecaprenyl-phosphate galactose phosphotransferase WbaP|nr:undecaprenyl-phosphate galactose phosphotransferase WbaP [Spirochaetaceae bacterium]